MPSIKSEHARLSPSNQRWVHCPGSVREEAAYPDIPSKAAIDGTGSHLLLEMCLTHDTRSESFLGEVIGVGHNDRPVGWIVHQDRCDRVNVCLDYVDRRKKELLEDYPSFEIKIETESKSEPCYYFGRDDWWGTVDITIDVYSDISSYISTPCYTEVIDFKDGRGYVSEKDNSQLISYIYGKTGPIFGEQKNNRMTIVQPKTNPPIRYVDIRSDDLYDKAVKLSEAAKRTDDPNAPLIPDDKGGKGYCRWCKHRDNCEARKGVSMKNANEFEGLLSQDIDQMDNETLSKMLDFKPMVDAIFKEAQEKAESLIKQGQILPGYAMRPGNSKKEWNICEDELVKKLKACKFKKEDIYEQKLISPAKVLGHPNLTKKQKERFESEYIHLEPGTLKLKPVSRIDNEKEIVDSFKDVALQCNTDQISFI